MKSADDALLIRKSRQGDLVAFEEIVRRKRERVFWTAYRIVGDEDAAKDVSQTVFVRTWRNLRKIDPDRPLDAWLHRTTVNLAIDAYRKSRREVRMFDHFEPESGSGRPDSIPGAASPETALAHAEVHDIFQRLAARLSPMQRAAFVLVEVEGNAADEAGRMLGVRPSTVRNHLLNARRQLRRHLRHLYPEYAAGLTSGKGGSS
jgi:RNA polymerase sigma-70 factor (ECF subfamily)